MRIISKFRDYYDSAAGAGVDMTRVYEREVRYQKTKVLEELDFQLPIGRQSRDRVEWGCVYFCGRRYPYLETKVRAPESFALLRTTSFDKRFANEVEVRSGPFNRRRVVNWSMALDSLQGTPDTRGLNLIHKSPVVVQRYRRLSDDIVGSVKWDERLLVINDSLRNVGFQRVLDPFAAFQEIDMFLNTILVADVMPATKMSDKEKVVSHGMDTRFSFRHRPRN